MAVIAGIPEPLMAAPIPAERGIRHGRHIVAALGISLPEEFKTVPKNHLLVLRVGIGEGIGTPTGIIHHPALGSPPNGYQRAGYCGRR